MALTTPTTWGLETPVLRSLHYGQAPELPTRLVLAHAEENYRNLDRKQRREKTLHTVPSRPLVQQTALYDSHWSISPPSPP